MTTSDSMFEEYFDVRQYTPKSSGEQRAFRVLLSISFSIFRNNFLSGSNFFSSIQEKKFQSQLCVHVSNIFSWEKQVKVQGVVLRGLMVNFLSDLPSIYEFSSC